MGSWSYTAGSYGRTVRVYERKGSSKIYAATSDGSGGEIRKSLGHSDREKAMEYADDQAAKLRKGLDELRGDTPTVKRVLKLYLRHRSPDKTEKVQKADKRQAKLWTRVLGPDADLWKLSRREWDAFVRDRRSGRIGPRGKMVPEKDRTPVSLRTVERDLRFLRAVCRWATEERDDSGRFLLSEDPTRGRPISPKKLAKRYGWQQHQPNRPVATHDRVDAIREVYREITMRVERGGSRETVESYLPEIFDLVVATGRRISAVCSLKIEDLDLERTPKAPDGAIFWPAETDKNGKEWRCPLSKDGRQAVERAIKKRERLLGRVGPGPLFPAPGAPTRAVRYEEASAWLREAEKEAKLEPQKGTLWHAYRRLWASARKDLPDVDVAQAGGWSSLEALKLAYQQPDDATMLRVVEHDAELREVR